MTTMPASSWNAAEGKQVPFRSRRSRPPPGVGPSPSVRPFRLTALQSCRAFPGNAVSGRAQVLACPEGLDLKFGFNMFCLSLTNVPLVAESPVARPEGYEGRLPVSADLGLSKTRGYAASRAKPAMRANAGLMREG
jgi:hypothetical protein